MTDKIVLNNPTSFQNDSTAVSIYTTNNSAITTAFDNTLSLNGQAPNQMQANLDMNSNQILNLPAPSSNTSPARLQDLVTSSLLTSSVFSLLPTPTTGNRGTLSVVTDSTTNTWGATITGGGANVVLAWSNGTAWTVIGK